MDTRRIGVLHVEMRMLSTCPRHLAMCFSELEILVHDVTHRHIDKKSIYYIESKYLDEVPWGENLPTYEIEVTQGNKVRFKRIDQ